MGATRRTNRDMLKYQPWNKIKKPLTENFIAVTQKKTGKMCEAYTGLMIVLSGLRSPVVTDILH